MRIQFEVLGVPKPKGSMRAFVNPKTRRVIMVNSLATTKPWQEAIVSAASEARGTIPPLEGPVEVRVAFYMPRPKSLPKRVTEPVTCRNDIDKLERTLLDALTRAGVWRDDGQVVAVTKRKTFAGGAADPLGPAGIPRAAVMVWAYVEAV